MLRYLLKTGPGPVAKIKSEAADLKLSWPTVLRARKELGVISEWHGRASYWQLP